MRIVGIMKKLISTKHLKQRYIHPAALFCLVFSTTFYSHNTMACHHYTCQCSDDGVASGECHSHTVGENCYEGTCVCTKNAPGEQPTWLKGCNQDQLNGVVVPLYGVVR